MTGCTRSKLLKSFAGLLLIPLALATGFAQDLSSSATNSVSYGSSQSVWSTSAVPANNYGPYIPSEMGMQFEVSQAGQIQGMRFYKNSQNTGTHVGHLWTSSGSLLASVTFTNESPSGWQTAMFSSPVVVRPNQIYVVSYYSPTGAFSTNLNFFRNSYTSGSITALSSLQAGGNGVYTFRPLGSFPNLTYESANYWVDIIFAPQISSGPLSIWSNRTVPANTYGPYRPAEMGERFQVSQAGQIQGIRFYKGFQNTGTHTGHLWDARGNLLASITFTNESASGWQSANFPQPVTVQANTTYTVSYYSPTGAFSVDLNYLNNSYTSGPITLLSSSRAGGNGVYSYNGPGSFPTQTYQAANYWVDVLFLPSTGTTPPPPPPPPPPGCTSQYTYPNTSHTPSPAPACPPPLPPNPNPSGSNIQDYGPIHACMLIADGVRYQAIQVTGVSGQQALNGVLYFGPGCSANQFADQIFFGQPEPFFGTMIFWFLHFWDEPATSAIWTVGNLTTPCIDYSKVPDCQ